VLRVARFLWHSPGCKQLLKCSWDRHPTGPFFSFLLFCYTADQPSSQANQVVHFDLARYSSRAAERERLARCVTLLLPHEKAEGGGRRMNS
jgi:hypothetical protein